MTNRTAITSYAVAVRAVADLDATERALKLALLTADSEISAHIGIALTAISDKRGDLQQQQSATRQAMHHEHSWNCGNDMTVSMPAPYSLELVEGSGREVARIWKYGVITGRVFTHSEKFDAVAQRYDRTEGYIIQCTGKPVGLTEPAYCDEKFPSVRAAIVRLVTYITE